MCFFLGERPDESKIRCLLAFMCRILQILECFCIDDGHQSGSIDYTSVQS